MLSYRHAFHAGSHADVLKHVTLIAIIEAMKAKDKPFFYLETHGGAGIYDLSSDKAGKVGEFETGIAKLWPRQPRQASIVSYLNIIRRMNEGDALRFYPGSPWIAKAVLGDNRMVVSELHGSDFKILDDLLRPYRQVKAYQQNGLHTLKSLLPPPERRGLIFIDPSYEIKTDYQGVVDAVQEGMKRFANGVYAIWYPLLKSGQQDTLLRGIAALNLPHAKIELKVPTQGDARMYGSGVIILNPPYGLAQNLNEIVNELIPVLAR